MGLCPLVMILLSVRFLYFFQSLAFLLVEFPGMVQIRPGVVSGIGSSA